MPLTRALEAVRSNRAATETIVALRWRCLGDVRVISVMPTSRLAQHGSSALKAYSVLQIVAHSSQEACASWEPH